MKTRLLGATLFVAALVFAVNTVSVADSHSEAEPADDIHKLVIQVNTDDEATQSIALDNVVNLQKHYGVDNIEIELVVYGSGLGMLTTESKSLQRITSLLQQEVVFTACGNTMDTIERNTGKKPTLIKGVDVFVAGVARIIELQEQGYAYIRP